MPEESWKIIAGFPMYEISSYGRIFSHHRMRVLSPRKWKSHTGSIYFKASLRIDAEPHYIFVHRLVAQAFIPNPDRKATVNHKDGNPSNNRVDNLEWATHRENIDHAKRTGLVKRGMECSNAKLSETDVIQIKNRLAAGEGQQKIADSLNVSITAVQNIGSGRTWSWLNA